MPFTIEVVDDTLEDPETQWARTGHRLRALDPDYFAELLLRIRGAVSARETAAAAEKILANSY